MAGYEVTGANPHSAAYAYDAQHELKLVTDNGCQPTSGRFMKSCSELTIKQIFTSWNNPKGNADTERVMRTLKEDIVWPYDWQSPFEFEHAFANWGITLKTSIIP